MKTYAKLAAIFTLSIAAFVPSLFAQLSIPSDGSDGALIISNNTVIDLSQAVTGNWTNNNAAHAGRAFTTRTSGRWSSSILQWSFQTGRR